MPGALRFPAAAVIAGLLILAASSTQGQTAGGQLPAGLKVYAGKVQSGIADSIATWKEAPQGWAGILRLWISPEGEVTKSEVVKTEGADVDPAALRQRLSEVRLPAMTEKVPMPLVLRIISRPKPATVSAAYARDLEKRVTAILRQMPDIPIALNGVVQLWLNGDGQVVKAQLAASAGLSVNEDEVVRQLLKLKPVPPPAGTPMPVSIHLKLGSGG